MNRGYHILEIANVHGGSFDYLNKLVDAVEKYKSPDFGIKFQVFKSDLIALPDFSYFHIYEELFFDFAQWEKIISKASKTKDVWIDVFDLYGVQAVNHFSDKVYGVKFQASVLDNLEVFKAFGEIDMTDKYVMVNVAGLGISQIQEKIKVIEEMIDCKEIIIQVGYQSYPTDIKYAGLHKNQELAKHFDHKVIYADHTEGESEDAQLLPLFALYQGYFGVEKHIMLNKEETKYDFQASFTISQLEDYLAKVDTYFKQVNTDFINDKERAYLDLTQQIPVANKTISKGKSPKVEDFYFRRTNADGLNLDKLKELISEGQILRKEIRKDQTIKATDFKKRNVAVIVACRMKSSRLKEKATLKIGDLSSIELCMKNALRIKEANHVVLATSDLESDALLKDYTYDDSVIFHTGDPEDVIRRYLSICDSLKVDTVIRLTGDCPYISSEIATELFDSHLEKGADYTAAKEFAVGTSMEIIEVNALKKIKEHFNSANFSEYMTWYFTNNPEHFNLNVVDLNPKYVRDYRLTLDYQEDLDMFNKIQDHFDSQNKDFTLERLFEYLDENPEVPEMNGHLTLMYKADDKLIEDLNKYTKIPTSLK